MNESCLTFIHALSPLHAGTGQGVGVIDLPIAREKATNLPFLPGSTLKGTLRDECEMPVYQAEIAKGTDEKEARKIATNKASRLFGAGGDSTASSGAAIFSDQRLLCLPVRSLFGTFAWVTSPYILERLQRDAAMTGATLEGWANAKVSKENCLTVDKSPLKGEIEIEENKQKRKIRQVILEDLDLTPQGPVVGKTDLAKLAGFLGRKIFPENEAWQRFFSERLCIVSDDVLNFLAETATEVTARNVLTDNKTSANLWYEESLPAETILSGLLATVHANARREEIFTIVKKLCAKPLQLGGNMTVGRGVCRIVVDYQEKGGPRNAHS